MLARLIRSHYIRVIMTDADATYIEEAFARAEETQTRTVRAADDVSQIPISASYHIKLSNGTGGMRDLLRRVVVGHSWLIWDWTPEENFYLASMFLLESRRPIYWLSESPISPGADHIIAGRGGGVYEVPSVPTLLIELEEQVRSLMPQRRPARHPGPYFARLRRISGTLFRPL